MSDILGLTLAHFPYLRLKHYHMPSVLTGNLGRGWIDKPHLKDPANWPQRMREEWGDDQGVATGKKAQDHEIEQFRKVRASLDDFKPDLIVIFYRDLGENFKNFAKVPYWIHGHNALATILHLDWDRHEFTTPVLPVAVDPFGFLRTRNNEGMSPWNRDLPRPLLPKEGFDLGRHVARVFKASPWRVALVAGTGWSHANDSGWEFERLHQDIEADLERYEEWRNNQFDRWGENFNFEDMEQHAQWELLMSIIIAGA